MHTHIHPCMHGYMDACIHACMQYMLACNTCLHANTHACTQACIDTYMHTCIHVSAKACIHACIHEDRHTYIHHIRSHHITYTKTPQRSFPTSPKVTIIFNSTVQNGGQGTYCSDSASSAIINWADLVTRVLMDADVPTLLGCSWERSYRELWLWESPLFLFLDFRFQIFLGGLFM